MKTRVPCELWAEMDRQQRVIDSACIVAIVLFYLGFTFEEKETEA